MRNKKLGQRKASLIAAENKRQARIARTKAIFKEAKKRIGRLTKRDRFITGIALYAAEGNKKDGGAGLANADPRLINFMMRWFKEFCKIPQSKFRGSIWLHENLDERKAKQFWSRLTEIPEKQFHKTYIAKNKTDSKKIRKNIHEFGVFSIKFSDSTKHRRIMGWIPASLGGKIKTFINIPR